MESNHGAPQDGMQSDNETEENTRPGLGAKEAAGTATDVAAKMAGVGRSTGSTLKSSKNVFN